MPPAGYGAPPPAYGAPAYGQPPMGAPYGGAELAGWGTRVGGTLIDFLLFIGIIVVGGILGGILSTASDGLGGLVFVLGYLAAIAFYVWQLVVQGKTGQTIGKRAVKIRLVKEADGMPVGGGMSVVRALAHNLEFLIGYLWPLWDRKKQTFADKLCGTLVIRA